MGRKNSFRIGKVRGDLRGKGWYLSYQENGRRVRPRVGSDQAAAKQLAAQVNSQLEFDAPTVLSFRPVKIRELQQHWLEHHDHVLRSSLQTIRRYRTATEHLLPFIDSSKTPQTTSHWDERTNECTQPGFIVSEQPDEMLIGRRIGVRRIAHHSFFLLASCANRDVDGLEMGGRRPYCDAGRLASPQHSLGKTASAARL